MREIAAAVEEGAKAYLSRQIKTISAIAVYSSYSPSGIFKHGHPRRASASSLERSVRCWPALSVCGWRLFPTFVRPRRWRRLAAQSTPCGLPSTVARVTGLLVVGLALISVGGFISVPMHSSIMRRILRSARRRRSMRSSVSRLVYQLTHLGLRPSGQRYLYQGGGRRRGRRRQGDRAEP